MMRGKGSLSRNLLLVSLPAALVVLAVVYAVWRSPPVALAVGAGVFATSVWSNGRFFGEIRRRKESRGDREAVQVTEVDASRVLDIETSGSHGPALVFFADNGKALLLAGQWLLGHRSFPSCSFRLYQWADTKKPIRIEPTGKRVNPEHSTAQLRPSYRLADVEVFEATPETLQHDLDRVFQETRA
jgi:hypothetical protein